jgi:hypothetical protein
MPEGVMMVAGILLVPLPVSGLLEFSLQDLLRRLAGVLV